MGKQSVSEQIVAIRVAAGGDADRCPTCCRDADAPYRRYDTMGNALEGCVDAVHEEHMAAVRPLACGEWHFRPAAVEMRRRELDAANERQAHRRSLAG